MNATQRLARLSRLVPSGSSGAARAPFALLVVLILGAGLVALLLLNASVNQGSFQLSRLEEKTQRLTEEQQELQEQVDSRSAPGTLEKRAREIGLVPGGNPVFLEPDGSVRGSPEPAVAEQEER